MEGPTPVSALIHAATMVTAGVYLIARMHPLFEHAPTAADVTAIGGCLTLLIAATIALVQVDIKRVIAYSTMSQIGYMIMAVSVGAYSAGLFHLMTHAFFKALLFMAAGLADRRDGGRPVARPDGRLPPGAAVHVRVLCDWRPGPVGPAAVFGLALEGRHPRLPRPPRRRLRGARDRRLRRRAADRHLHVPDDLPRVLSASPSRRPASSSTGTSLTPRCRATR